MGLGGEGYRIESRLGGCGVMVGGSLGGSKPWRDAMLRQTKARKCKGCNDTKGSNATKGFLATH